MTDLPLTIPVALTVMEALSDQRAAGDLDREGVYLLARLESAKSDAERKAALLRAIEDTTY